MSRKGVKLEPYRLTPTGGKAPRCQAVRNGKQCGQYARQGFDVCWKCGAGSKKREEAGEARPAGRPPLGIYAKRPSEKTLLDLAADQLELERGNDLSRELLFIKAALSKFISLEPDITLARTMLEQAMRQNTEDPYFVMDAAKLIARFNNYLFNVQDMAINVGKLAKLIAEIENKTAQTKALEVVASIAHELKTILGDYVDPRTYELIFERIQQEIIEPNVPKVLSA